MKIKVGISNRHIHLTKEDYIKLFNEEELNIKKELYQEGYFAADKTVTIKTQKNTLENVRVMGPFRTYTQVEISKTDSYKLGINPPVRNSGDLKGAETVTIIGEKGELTIPCCIIPTRHIHITKEDHIKLFNEKENCAIKISNQKTTILDDIKFKIAPKSKIELHLDTDDANAALLTQGEDVEMM